MFKTFFFTLKCLLHIQFSIKVFNQQQQQKDLMTIFLNQSFDSLISQPLNFGSTVVIHIDTYLDLLLVVVATAWKHIKIISAQNLNKY